MRKTLTSLAVVGAAGALLAAGGAYSVFNDAGTSTGGLTAGTVKLSVTDQVPATDVFGLAGPCTKTYADRTSPTDALNMGTVNNVGCVSHFTVHNAGSLPFELSGTTVSDSNPTTPVALTCVTSTITDGTKSIQVLPPGADQVVTVATATVNDVKGCQNLTDKVTVSLVATEAIYNPAPVATGAWQIGQFDGPGSTDTLNVNVPSGEWLEIMDYQASGDVFDVSVDGVDLGHTSSAPSWDQFQWDIPSAWGDPAFSKGSFRLTPGPHTVVVTFLGGPGFGNFAYRV